MDLKVAIKVASIFEKNIKEILEAIEKETDQIKKGRIEYFKEIERLRENINELWENGSIDSSIREYYKDDKSREYQLYQSVVPTIGECAFATKKDWTEIDIDLEGSDSIFKYDSEVTIDFDMKQNPPHVVYSKLKILEELGIKLWDAPIYTLNKVSVYKNKIEVNFQTSTYFKHRFRFGEIQHETLEYARGLKKKENLYLRNNFGSTLKKFADSSKRIMPTGINALVAIRRKDDYALVLQKRSQTVSEIPGAFAVIPSAIHQPMLNASDEVHIRDTIWREIYEELLGGEEATGPSRHIIPRWYMNVSPAMKEITAIGATDIRLTGCGYALLTGFFDFCILVMIKIGSFWEKNKHLLKSNWEVDEDLTPIVSSMDKEAIKGFLNNKGWSPSARVAFEQGMILLNKIDEHRCVKITEL